MRSVRAAARGKLFADPAEIQAQAIPYRLAVVLLVDKARQQLSGSQSKAAYAAILATAPM